MPSPNKNVGLDQTAAILPETAPASVALMFPVLSGKPTRDTPKIKRLLRHRFTRLYFSEGGWTEDPLQASVFADCLQAAQACARHGLTDVELSLHLGAGSLDFFSTPLR